MDSSLGELTLPEARPLTELDGTFVVCEETVEGTDRSVDPQPGPATLGVPVSYQACTDVACFPPRVYQQVVLSGLDSILWV